ncbi:MAG: hypothetical protein ACHQIG_13430 [Acidimicrobiia bacterium]
MREFMTPLLAPGETMVAMLPFASTPKRPRGPEGKVRDGIWQSARLHRPLALTDRALYVFEAGRTPLPRYVHGAYARDRLHVVGVQDRRFGVRVVTLTIDGEGDIPFETGTKDDLDTFVASLT